MWLLEQDNPAQQEVLVLSEASLSGFAGTVIRNLSKFLIHLIQNTAQDK